jgi:hypothetical protein
MLAQSYSAYAEKPYNCYDHYPDKVCDKQLGKTTEKTSTVTAITADDIVKLGDRTTVDKIKDNIKNMNIEQVAKEKRVVELESSIISLEKQVSNALNDLRKKTNSYDNAVSELREPARLEVVKSQKILDEVKAKLKKDVDEKQVLVKGIRDLKNQIIKTTKLLATSDKAVHNKKNAVSVQTIGIKLGNTCITMIKNNITTTCPTYAGLLALNLDSSKKESGIFSFFNGYYHRGSPLLKNDDKLYDLNSYNIIIDPSSVMTKRIKTITIQPSLNNFLLDDGSIKINNTRIIHKDRYVDNCSHATISAVTWINTLSDTVNYLRSGCVGTLLNSVDNFTDSTTVTDITTSAKWKHDQWIKEAKEKYKTSHIGSRENGTNKATTEDEG